MPPNRSAVAYVLSRALNRLGAVAIIALLAACATSPTARGGADVAVATPEAAARAEEAGDAIVAAELYSRLAAQSKPPAKQDYALKSVETLVSTGQAREAHDRLAPINTSGLAPVFATRKQILAARVAVLTDQPEEALRLIAPVAGSRGISPAHAAEAHRVRADAYLRLRDPFDAVRSLIAREQYIAAKEAIAANQQEIWQILESQPRDAIDRERSAAREPVYSGWLALASTVQANAGSPARLSESVQTWRKQHVTHPASDLFLLTLASPPAQILERVGQVTLLLPLSGGNRSVQQAAESVRDGFLAMHAADTRATKPKVRVLDIGADPERVSDFWAQSAREGADLIVGPLGLEAVNALVRRVSLDTPTILLTHTSESIRGNVKQVFQFGLPPEQEAEQAAERAWLDGHRRAAVLFPDSNWGRRMSSAFTSRWQRLGGAVVGSHAFPPSGTEYSLPVRELLNITHSEERGANLEKNLRMRLHFTPRAREDIDVIFLAADAPRARLIKPQLNYHRAARVPVYATSQVFTGRGERATDADLDGITFGDMPWMLIADGDIGGMRSRVQGGWPFAHSSLDRLYALGMDAYSLIGELNRLGLDPAATMSGASSVLRVDENGRVQRSMTWARFSGGVPQLLDRFANKRGQFEGTP